MEAFGEVTKTWKESPREWDERPYTWGPEHFLTLSAVWWHHEKIPTFSPEKRSHHTPACCYPDLSLPASRTGRNKFLFCTSHLLHMVIFYSGPNRLGQHPTQNKASLSYTLPTITWHKPKTFNNSFLTPSSWDIPGYRWHVISPSLHWSLAQTVQLKCVLSGLFWRASTPGKLFISNSCSCTHLPCSVVGTI